MMALCILKLIEENDERCLDNDDRLMRRAPERILDQSHDDKLDTSETPTMAVLNPHHKPGLAPSLVVLGVLLSGLQLGPESTHAASTTARAGVLSADERSTLLQYAKDTWRSFDRLVLPSGLPADGLRQDSEGRTTPWMQTSPTDIAAYLWSVLAAERLHLIGASEARSRLDRTLTTLAGMDRTHGFFVNELDPRTGVAFKISPFDSSPSRLRLSAVDNAWLAVALTMVANANPSLRKRRRTSSKLWIFATSMTLTRWRIPSLILVSSTWATGPAIIRSTAITVCSTRRPASSATSVSPAVNYLRNTTTVCSGPCPRAWDRKGNCRAVRPASTTGSVSSRVLTITVAFASSPVGGEVCWKAMMVTLFVPEDFWAPRSWGINHPLYVRAQIEHGLKEVGYGYWGFSPAASPQGGYQVYGVKALGTYDLGYFSHEIGEPVRPHLPPRSSSFAHGVVTPHASFLALRYAPHEAIANLRPLPERSQSTAPWDSRTRWMSRWEWLPVASLRWTRG